MVQLFASASQGKGQFPHAYQTTFKYEISDNAHARTTNYRYQIVVEQLHISDAQSEKYQPLSRTTFPYKKYRNPTSIQDELVGSDSNYRKPETMRNEYVATMSKTQLLVKQTTRDEITNGEYLSENTLMGDEKNIKTTSISFMSGSSSTDAPIRPWWQRLFTYNVPGIVLTSTTAWSPAAKMPDESSSNEIYEKLRAPSFKNVSRSDKQNFSNMTRLTGLLNKPMLWVHRPFTAYSVGSGADTQTVTSPVQYIKRAKFDALGHEVEAADNRDPASDPNIGVTRTSAPALVLGIKAGVIADILTCGLADIGFAALGASAVKASIAASTIGGAARGAGVAAARFGVKILTAGAVGGGAGTLAQGTIASALAHKPIDAWQILLSAATGAVIGALGRIGISKGRPVEIWRRLRRHILAGDQVITHSTTKLRLVWVMRGILRTLDWMCY
ncbi:hypothetical protein MMC29_002430 [Sticta canariensis]|nr:hypothetical protein [Sticta canariensis]